MPQAASGAEDKGGYSYTVNATIQQVRDFYDRQMPAAGWQPFAVGTGSTGAVMLLYQKNGVTTTVAVVGQGEVTLVLLLQS